MKTSVKIILTDLSGARKNVLKLIGFKMSFKESYKTKSIMLNQVSSSHLFLTRLYTYALGKQPDLSIAFLIEKKTNTVTVVLLRALQSSPSFSLHVLPIIFTPLTWSVGRGSLIHAYYIMCTYRFIGFAATLFK